MSSVVVDGETATITFDSYGMDDYPLFLRAKTLPESQLTYDWERDRYQITTAARFAHLLGVTAPAMIRATEPLADHLFDYQAWAVRMALDAKRFAIWADTGLGKGPMILEWCRQVHLMTGGRVLILEPGGVIPQLIAEAHRFYGEAMAIKHLHTRAELIEWCEGKATPSGKYWRLTKDGDPKALALYERHYSAHQYRDGRKRKLFVGPGEKLVLISQDGKAMFAWRKFKSAAGQTGVNCAVFRNEGQSLSSDMIREAMEWAWQRWPGERLYTYVDPDEVASPNPGYCFKRAGWRSCGVSKDRGLTILEATYPAFAITNYEKFVPRKRGDTETISELRYLAGLAADEASILRTGGGTIKWSLIKSAKGIEYKLACTATPAPNEAMEYASQASFLEKLRNEGEILWTYFQRDKYGTWFIKPHAKAAFYRFMASWSLYMRNPATFGFGDILAGLPDPVMHEERIALTDEQRERMTEMTVRSGKGLFADDRLGVKERSKFAQLARGFVYENVEYEDEGTVTRVREIVPVKALKPRRVADIARNNMRAGKRVLIWTTFDEEGDILYRHLASFPVAILTGSQSDAERQAILDDFRQGRSVTCLISKPNLIGYGLNLQFVTSMIFSGIDDSMERRYQAIRRAYRFGQTEPVHVHTVYVPELEGVMFDNVAGKEARFLEEVAIQEQHYRKALGVGGA